MTRQRAAIWDTLGQTDEFRSAQQLHDALGERGESIGLATVYRALQALAESDDVDVLRTADGENLFRSCSTQGHHHHLICRSCGETRELEARVVEEWAQRVGAEHGFTDMEHVVDLFGICANCRASRGAAGA